MYKIFANDTVIYDSRREIDYLISNPVLNLELGQAGNLEFEMLPGNPYINSIFEMRTYIKVTQDNSPIFYGRVLRVSENISGTTQVICEGALTFLLDSELAPFEGDETLSAFFARCIQSHNSQVEAAKRFQIGRFQSTNASKSIDFNITGYTQTRKALDSYLISKIGGFLIARLEGSTLYLDYVQDFTSLNSQPIEIGYNIIEREKNISIEDMFTILRPLGKDDLTIEGASGKNLIANAGSVVTGKSLIDSGSEKVTPNDKIKHSNDYIPVEPGSTYSFGPGQVDITYYNSEKKPLYTQEISEGYSTTVPTGRQASGGRRSVPNFDSIIVGNVDLEHRPTIPTEKLIEQGWDEAEPGGYATVFSSTYSAGDIDLGYDYPMRQNAGIVITPIMQNGNVISPWELEYYLESIISRSKGIEDLLKNDSRGKRLIIGVMPITGSLDAAYAFLGEWAEYIHNQQALLYGGASEIAYAKLSYYDEYDSKITFKKNGESLVGNPTDVKNKILTYVAPLLSGASANIQPPVSSGNNYEVVRLERETAADAKGWNYNPNYIPVEPGWKYIAIPGTISVTYYDSNKICFAMYKPADDLGCDIFTVPAGASFMRISYPNRYGDSMRVERYNDGDNLAERGVGLSGDLSYSYSEGEEVSAGKCYNSGYIPVEGNTYYTGGPGQISVSLYDSEKTYLGTVSGDREGQSQHRVKTSYDARYVRISYDSAYIGTEKFQKGKALVPLQLEKGTQTITLVDRYQRYGSIIHTEYFNDIDDPNELYAQAVEWLNRHYSSLPLYIDLSIVDFHLLNPSIQKFDLGDVYTNVSGFDGEIATISKLTKNLENPGEDKLTLSNKSALNEATKGAKGAHKLSSQVGQSSSGGGGYGGYGGLMGSSSLFKHIRDEDDDSFFGVAGVDEIGLAAKELLHLDAPHLRFLANSTKEIKAQLEMIAKGLDGEESRFTLNEESSHLNTKNAITDAKNIYNIADNIVNVAGIVYTHSNLIWNEAKDIVTIADNIYNVADNIINLADTVYTQANTITDIAGNVEIVDDTVKRIFGSAIHQTMDELAMGNGILEIDQDGVLHVREGSGLKFTKDGTEYGLFTDDVLDAGAVLTRILDEEGETIDAKFGTYVNDSLDAGVIVERITDPNLGQVYKTTLGTYVNGVLDAGIIVTKINNSEKDESTTLLLADHVLVTTGKTLDGKLIDVDFAIAGRLTADEVAATYVTIAELNAEKARFDNLTSGIATATSLKASLLQADSNLNVQGSNFGPVTLKVGNIISATVLSTSQVAIELSHYHSISATEGTGANAGKILLTLGAPQLSAGTANFNIAATQFYQDGVAAAIDSVTLSSEWSGSGDSYTFIVTASNEKTVSTIISYAETEWNRNHRKTVTITATDKPNDSRLFQRIVDATSIYTEGYSDGYFDGNTGVTLASSWSGSGNSYTYTVTASNGETVSTTLTGDSGSWANNQRIITITASNKPNDNRVFQYTITAPTVALSGPTWNDYTGNTPSNRTFTVSASNGAEKSATLYLIQGSWSNDHKKLVYMRQGSESGYIRAALTVDATDVYNDGVAAGTGSTTVYYWENNTRYSFPSGGKRLSGGVDIMVGTSTSNRYWVLYPTATTLSSAWSGSGNTQTYTLTGTNVNSKSMSLTYSESAWSNGSKTITVTSSDKPNDNRVFQHTVTAPVQTVYYWENNTRYSFPSGGKRLSGGVDIMVGTSESNRRWVLYPTVNVSRSAWSGGHATFSPSSGSGSSYELYLGYQIKDNVYPYGKLINMRQVDGQYTTDTGYNIALWCEPVLNSSNNATEEMKITLDGTTALKVRVLMTDTSIVNTAAKTYNARGWAKIYFTDSNGQNYEMARKYISFSQTFN